MNEATEGQETESQEADGGSGQEGGRHTPKKSRLRKWSRRIGCGFLTIILLLVAYVTINVLIGNYRGEQARKEILAEVRALGIPTDTSQLFRRAKPEEYALNGTRFYLAAFMLAVRDDGLRSRILYPPEDQRYSLCEPIPAEVAAGAARFVESEREFFSLIEQGRQHTLFFYNFGFAELGTLDPRANRGLEETRRNLRVLCVHRQACGDGDAALDACAAIVDVSRSLAGEADWWFWMMIRSISTVAALRDAQQALSRTTASTQALDRLRSSALAEARTRDLKAVVEAQITCLAEDLRHLQSYLARSQRGIEAVLEALGGMPQDLEYPPTLTPSSVVRARLAAGRILFALRPGIVKLMLAERIKNMLTVREQASRPSHEMAEWANRVAFESKDALSEEATWAGFMLGFIGDEARMRVMAAALAVEAHRLEHGAWPEKLADLDEAQPSDPFTGKDLKYERTDEGCLLYSVGENLRDDGGKYDSELDKDDIAFRLFDVDKRNHPVPKSKEQE